MTQEEYEHREKEENAREDCRMEICECCEDSPYYQIKNLK